MACSVVDVRTKSLEQKIGQMLLIGYPGGQEGFATLAGVLSERPIGNIILFSRNSGSPSFMMEQSRKIRALITGNTGIQPLIAIDQEGGTVARIVQGITLIPGAMAIAAAFEAGEIGLADVERLGLISGTELMALGINMNLAPVADINVNPANPVIAVRSFGEDPHVVAELSAAFARGLASAGMLATAKHFPGHGDTTVDSHLSLPVVNSGLSRLEDVELVPFKRLIKEEIAAVMSAHVRFPAVEPDAIPATLSSRVLTGLLRERLGYRGLILTDCLEMQAVQGRFDKLAVRAVLAGADILCLSHTASVQNAAFDSILAAVRDGTIPETRIDDSFRRILEAKSRIGVGCADDSISSAALRSPAAVALSAKVAKASISVLSGKNAPWLARGGTYIDLLPEIQTGAEDYGPSRRTVSSYLSSMQPKIKSFCVGLDPDDSSLVACLGSISAGPVVVGVYALGKHPGQGVFLAGIAAECARRGIELFCVSMRSPYDAELVETACQGAVSGIACAYEYTDISAEAIAEFLCEVSNARGICPVRVFSRIE